MNESKIPLHIIEEHHEAFLIWMRAIKEKKIKKNNNTLLHFDDHSDMTTLRVNKSMHKIFDWTDEELVDFTYNNLTIASFIITASYLKVFKEVIWCKVDMSSDISNDIYITTYNDDKKNLISGRFNKLAEPLLRFDHNKVNYKKTSLDRFKYFDEDESAVLDIDLDFFSCMIQPENNNEIIIEITKNEYEEYNMNRHHPINFISNRVEVMKEDSSYYFVINYYKDIFPSPRKVTKIIIEHRINLFIEKIKSNKIKPSIITVCRSRISGYTPEDQWEFIEEKLLENLKQCFDFEIFKLQQDC